MGTGDVHRTLGDLYHHLSVSTDELREEESEEEMLNLVLMKMTHTMTHLSETYLLF